MNRLFETVEKKVMTSQDIFKIDPKIYIDRLKELKEKCI